MCVPNTLKRSEVLAGIAGASLFAFGKPAKAATPKRLIVQLPPVRPYASEGVKYAARIATGSKLIMRSYSELTGLAAGIHDQKLAADVTALLFDPIPHYAIRLRDTATRNALTAALLEAKFIDKLDAIDGFLPDATRDYAHSPQPFWTIAGSAQDSHHAYPGGLVLHELFNARSSVALAQSYDDLYFGGTHTINRDIVVAAALYHDVMKSIVFQWNADGSLTKEPNIAGTGAHHVLSGAEAIARGHDARFVTVLLSAHAAPSLGDEVKVAAWARAAAMVAGVDPVEYGLLERSGGSFVLAQLPPVEAFVNYLSDHDYVLSVHAMHAVAPRIDALVLSAGTPPALRLWYRNAVLANTSAIHFYHHLAQDERAFQKEAESALSQISL